jgi:hypothetical protein
MPIKTTAVQTNAADSTGPDGIDPETCAKVLRWAWTETGLDILRSMAAQQEGRVAYLAAREAAADGKVTP